MAERISDVKVECQYNLDGNPEYKFNIWTDAPLADLCVLEGVANVLKITGLKHCYRVFVDERYDVMSVMLDCSGTV